ncbi:biopolymer transporter TolR [Leptospira idonii]|uniref:Biopolymer transporter TolR n=1 Tax=Leptospira idonii TaxID=1193500 RepID=A0A4R9LY83_9LEPT|nr:biopolymer transporter TolR [Leptospira idonii]
MTPVNFNYTGISKNYFSPSQTKPFPLTVQRGNNLYNSTTADGRYLFYATDQNGNFDIWFRDLQSSVVVPVTNHSFSESKPSISPDGRYLVFVSEEFDSDGDLVLLEMDIKDWVDELLQGNRFIDDNFVNLTNPNAKKEGIKQKIVDTDPVWSPDGKYILYVTDKFTPGLPNLALLNPKKPDSILQLTKDGGVNPSWSKDGSKIFYISYKDDKNGEIYSLNFPDLSEKKITENSFLNYSPSVDAKGQYIYYASIRKDTNGNGSLDERDNSYLVMRHLESGKERLLSSGETSYFDVRYSSFNGGSILFSAPYYNSINVYFIPESGSVPKQGSINDQYQYAKSFANKQTLDSYFLALDSVELFFSEDPLYPIYQAKVKSLKVSSLDKAGKSEQGNRILKDMSGLPPSPESYFERGFGRWLSGDPKTRNRELEIYIESLPSSNLALDTVPSLMHILVDEYEKEKNFKKTNDYLNQIYRNYPDYNQIHEIRRRLGGYEFHSDTKVLPPVYSSIFADWEKERIRFEADPKTKFSDDLILDVRFVLEDISAKIESGRNADELGVWADNLLQVPENQNERIFSSFLNYIKARSLADSRKFRESSALLDSIIPIPTNIDLEPPGQPSVFEKTQFQSVYKNPVLLRAHLQKYQNEKSSGNTSEALRNMKIYLEFYDPLLGVDLKVEEIQNAFFYFENKALEFERLGDLLQSSFHYFFNNQNMFLVKTRNLYLDTLYKEYAVYYQRKMVDTIFDYGKKLREEEERALLSQLNILGKDKLNLIGNVSDAASVVTFFADTKLLKNVINIKDLENIEVLSGKALSWTELYYKQAVPRARPYLDLATLYGYAYFLINKYVIFESYYYATDTMTDLRKKEILENYKRAEWELKWIIFADPTYYDAYQLLGWLYQYVDLMKLRQEKKGGETDEEKYASLYSKYFPEKNLEANVELYSQILVFLGASYPDAKVISDLNLNLGNNHFLLNNYPKANESYLKVEAASQYLLSKNQFEQYKQEAVFRYNFGRSLIYQGQYKKAIEQFEKSIDIYFKKEYYQAVNSAASDDSDANKERLKNIRSKLALLFSLKGLSELESQKYQEAAVSFQTAIAYNNNINFINPINLYNYLAIAFQKAGRFRDSYAMLDLAEKEYQKEKESFWVKALKWSPWDLVISEKFRVYGEGRFPGDFPVDFKYLLSLGVRIENHIEQREYSLALQELNSRNQFILDKSLDKTIMGANILAKSKQVAAQIHYENRENDLAVDSYKELTDLILKQGNGSSKEKAFVGFGYSVFSFVESNLQSPQTSKEKLLSFLEDLKSWKEGELKVCGQEGETEAACEDEFRSSNIQFDILLGTGYFYLGEVNSKLNDSNTALENYAEAAYYLENPGYVDPKKIGLNTDPLKRKERIRILHNLATIYFRLGDRSLFDRKWKEAYELAYEFRLEDEIFWLNNLKLEVQLHKKNESAKSLTSTASEIVSSWKKRPEVRLFSKRTKLDRFNRILTDYYLQIKDYASIPSLWEERRSVDLFREALGAQFEFEDSKLNLAYVDLVSWVKNYKKLISQMEDKSQKREDLNPILKAYGQEVSKLSPLLQKVVSVSPDRTSFFEPFRTDFGKTSESWLGVYPGENRFLFLQSLNGNYQLSFCEIKNISECSLPLNPKHVYVQGLGTNFDHSLLGELSGFLKTGSREISYLFDRRHLNLFPERNERNWKWVTLLQSGKEKNPASHVRVLHQSELGPLLYDTDILITDRVRKLNGSLFADSSSELLPLREIFTTSGSEISLAAVPYSNLITSYDWNRLGYLYEVLRSKRIQNLALFPDAKTESEIAGGDPDLSLLSENPRLVLFGNWDKKTISPEERQNKAKDLIRKGFVQEKEKDFNESYNHYYTASTLLGDDDPSLPELELKLAKLKTELFPTYSKKAFFQPLWKKYKDSEFQNKIRYEYLVSCLSDKNTEDCGKMPEVWIGANSNLYAKAVQFYKKLRFGKVAGLSEFDSARKELEKEEDPFLQSYRLGTLYIQNYLFYEAENELSRSYSFAKTAKEKNVAKNRELEILFHKGMLYGDKGIFLTNLTSTSAYSLGFRKDWKVYDEKIYSREFTKFGYADSIYDQFRKKLYQSWKDQQIRGYFDPLVLTPEFLTTGDSVLNKLSHLNRTLMFSLLSKSVPLQKKSEVNSLVDLILQEEVKEERPMRVLAFQLLYAKKLFLRGDTEAAEKFLKEFESEYAKLGAGNRFLDEEYTDLKYKVGYIYGNPASLRPLGGNDLFISYYPKIASSNPENYLSFVNEIARNLRSEYYSEDLREEWEFLFLHLLNQSLAKNSSETFFDLAVARDQIRVFADRYLGDKTFGRSIPRFDSFGDALKKKIPSGQELTGVVDVGKKTYQLSFTQNKSSGRELFADNREIGRDVLRYFLESELGGLETLLRDAVSDRYRNSLRLAKGKRHYLYLQGIHSKAPIQLPDLEYYHVASVSDFINRPSLKKTNFVQSRFEVGSVDDSKSIASDDKIFSDLISWEVAAKKGTASSVLDFTKIYWNDDNFIDFAGTPVGASDSYRRKGIVFYANNRVGETTFYSDDFPHLAYFLSKKNEGLFVLHSGLQKGTHNIYFAKKFFEISPLPKPMYVRLEEGKDAARIDAPEDRYWTGFKLYTTSLIED